MTKPKIISQRKIYDSDRFDVFKTKLQLANKKNRVYDSVERDPSVFIFPLTEKNEIYLIRQYRYLFNRVFLEAVAGFICEGESSIHAAKRELKEETGLIAFHWEELIRINLSNSVIKTREYLFLAKDIQEEKQSPDEDEDIEVVKMPLPEAIAKVLTGEITDAGTILGLLLLDKLKREKKL